MDGDQVQTFPKNRQELIKKRISEVYQRSGDVFHNQRLTDFEGWENLPHGSANNLPYHRSGIESMICDPGREPEQEPYYIVKKSDLAPYNVLFAGMWWDKTTQIIDACNCGLAFVLHPDLFAVIFDEHVPLIRAKFRAEHLALEHMLVTLNAAGKGQSVLGQMMDAFSAAREAHRDILIENFEQLPSFPEQNQL